jgi:primosomal protein N'
MYLDEDTLFYFHPRKKHNTRTMEEDDPEPRPFPSSIEKDLNELLSINDRDQVLCVVWESLTLKDLDTPFKLPDFPNEFDTISHFVTLELQTQVETIRDDVNTKVKHLDRVVQKDEKFLRFPLPRQLSYRPRAEMPIDFRTIYNQPSRGQFTNYVVLFQQQVTENNSHGMPCTHMRNLTLAYCSYLRQSGASFVLGADAEALNYVKGEQVYVRVLRNFNMTKTHLNAMAGLHQSEGLLNQSFVTRQLLNGKIEADHLKTLSDLDGYVQKQIQQSNDCKSRADIDLKTFNQQQQRALALEALTDIGTVLIQGPPGMGKSHILCHGILPQVVARGGNVLVLCNSNVAVDALMLKCFQQVPALKCMMLRCGFKDRVRTEICDLGLYAEGDMQGLTNTYGKHAGANSNTEDPLVQYQI